MKPYQRNEMNHIFDSWDYHLREKLEGADRIVRVMTSEMSKEGIKQSEYVPFLQQKLGEMIQSIAKGASA